MYEQIIKYIQTFSSNIDIRIRFMAEYYSNIFFEHWSLKINGNIGIKGVLFSFLMWRYILTTLSITMIISGWSAKH